MDYFSVLDLEPGASLADVKQAYRNLAKRFHPDAPGPYRGDSSRFMSIHQAYRALAARLAGQSVLPPVEDADSKAETGCVHDENRYGRRLEKCGPVEQSSHKAPVWRMLSMSQEGADICYLVEIGPECSNGLSMELPWRKEDACPRCLGLGHTLWPMFGGPHLSRAACLNCQGSGVIAREAVIQIVLSRETVERGVLRLTGQGCYQPVAGKRGDLVVRFKTTGGVLAWYTARSMGESRHGGH